MKINSTFAYYPNRNNNYKRRATAQNQSFGTSQASTTEMQSKAAASSAPKKIYVTDAKNAITRELMADGNFSVAKSCVDILGGSEDHLEDLANHLFYTDDETIKTHIAIIEWPFDFVNKKQSDRAFTKLMPYVKDVRRKYASLRQKEREALMAFNNNPSKENEVKLRELNKEMQKMVANVSSATTLLAYSCGESTYQENEDINRRIDLALSGAIY